MGLSSCDESLTERLDGDNVLEAISEDLVQYQTFV